MSAERIPWSDEENDRVVAAYFRLLERDLDRIARGEPSRVLNKAAVYQSFQGRVPSSVERKMQNISAILEQFGRPWVSGLVPAENFQRSLVDAVWRHLNSENELPVRPPSNILPAFVAAPELGRSNIRLPDHVRNLVRQFDPAERDERNRTLGKAGEELIFNAERARLARVLPKRVDDVKWVSRDEGDGHGYDIRSFDDRGEEQLIEVKTTQGVETTPFFLSRNERRVAEQTGEAYRIFRVFNYGKGPKVFTLKPPLEAVVNLEPHVFVASFR